MNSTDIDNVNNAKKNIVQHQQQQQQQQQQQRMQGGCIRKETKTNVLWKVPKVVINNHDTTSTEKRTKKTTATTTKSTTTSTMNPMSSPMRRPTCTAVRTGSRKHTITSSSFAGNISPSIFIGAERDDNAGTRSINTTDMQRMIHKSSKNSTNNLLKIDPDIRNLLSELDTIDDCTKFWKWKQSFIEQYETTNTQFNDNGIIVAQKQYEEFCSVLKEFYNKCCQLQDAMINGLLTTTTSSTSVKGWNTLNECHHTCIDITERLVSLVSTTMTPTLTTTTITSTGTNVNSNLHPTVTKRVHSSDNTSLTTDSNKCQYTKYQLGLILLRDNFSAYDTMVSIKSILLQLRDDGPCTSTGISCTTIHESEPTSPLSTSSSTTTPISTSLSTPSSTTTTAWTSTPSTTSTKSTIRQLQWETTCSPKSKLLPVSPAKAAATATVELVSESNSNKNNSTMKVSLRQIADRQIIDQIDKYVTKIEHFCDVMASLSLIDVMNKCIQYKGCNNNDSNDSIKSHNNKKMNTATWYKKKNRNDMNMYKDNKNCSSSSSSHNEVRTTGIDDILYYIDPQTSTVGTLSKMELIRAGLFIQQQHLQQEQVLDVSSTTAETQSITKDKNNNSARKVHSNNRCSITIATDVSKHEPVDDSNNTMTITSIIHIIKEKLNLQAT